MAEAIRRRTGDTVNYTPATDVTAGEVVVQGELVGIAAIDLPAGKLGALAVKGVFEIQKTAGAGEAITAGAVVYWDATGRVALEDADSGANKKLGKVETAAADNDVTVYVRLSQ